METTENTEKPVSRRIHVTLPDKTFALLERWADDQGRPTANLAAFLLEKAIEQAIREGKLSDMEDKKLNS